MDPERRVFVSIYCKIYANSFSEKMINAYATGTEIYEFLMKSAGVCFDPDGFPLPGDCNLWYLGCCEKFAGVRTNFASAQTVIGRPDCERSSSYS